MCNAFWDKRRNMIIVVTRFINYLVIDGHLEKDMSKKNLNVFNQQVSVTYRGDLYLVRDNGAVCRQRRESKRKRPLDDVWTFGNFTVRDGYMKICSIPIHRVVATAFHGEQPTPDHVVDHIDTNRMNNNPENLRWVTRLENILDNPKTLRRIENKWGSIDGLLNDPNRAEITDPLTNRPWMRQALMEDVLEVESTIDSLTPLAMQRDWRTPSEFPMCPDKISKNPLVDYVSRLECGAVFSQNKYGASVVDTAELNTDGTCLSVLCINDSGIKNYAVAKVTFEIGKYIHTSISTYFTYEGAAKSHCNLTGKPWENPEGYEGCIDDYC